jgi:hypothetical protein
MSEQYFREGAGSALNSAQLAQATQLQDQYIYYICRQAGFNADTAVGSSCEVGNWTAFTVAGMNDIDQRCDAYLNWLDAQRRDRTPVLGQIAAMGAAASGIMGVAGAGTAAIAIVATAFGLAGTTYANWNSRLLLDVDHSTVQAVVYKRQVQYRQDNTSAIGSVHDRPTAIYLLRNYLRICMPITIETDINNTVTLVQSGAPPDVARAPLVRSVGLLTSRAIAGARISELNKPVVESPRPPLPAVEAELISQVQLALCVPNDGVLGGDTVQAIQTYLKAKGKSVPKNIDARSLQPILQEPIDDVGDCRKKGFKNAYEVGAFGVPATHTEHKIQTLQKNINAFFAEQKVTGKDIIVTGKLDTQTRTAISQVNQLLSLPEGDEIGSELNLRLH